MRWWKLAGEKGDKSSQYLLGSTYYFGHVVHKNYKKAAYWLEKAALQDDDWAQVLLGDCYYWGRGVAKNYETARKQPTLATMMHNTCWAFVITTAQEKPKTSL